MPIEGQHGTLYDTADTPLSSQEVGRPKGAQIAQTEDAENFRNMIQNENTACKYPYDSAAIFTNLSMWRGTVLPGLITRPFFWINVLTYAAAATCYNGFHDTCGIHLPQIVDADISPALSLAVFFLAFYSNSCYSRFHTEYAMLKSIEGRMRNVGILVRYNFQAGEGPNNEDGSKMFPDEDILLKYRKYKMLEVLRLLGASYYLLYACLYDGEMFKFSADAAYKAGLISEQEKVRLVEEGQQHSKKMQWYRCLSWAYGAVIEAVDEDICEKDDADDIKGDILMMRDAMNNTCFEAEMPIPFSYYHIITILTIFTTVSFSYAAAFVDTSQGIYWCIYMCVMFGLLGMREVAIQMSDPFGDDDSDLPVDNYVDNVLEFLTHYIHTAKMRPRVDQKFHKDNHFLVAAQYGVDQHIQAKNIVEVGYATDNKLLKKV